jgi:hypothetical protein
MISRACRFLDRHAALAGALSGLVFVALFMVRA